MITLKINGVTFEVLQVERANEEAVIAFLPDMQTMSWKPADIPFWDTLFFTTHKSLGTFSFDETEYILRFPNPQKKGDKYVYTMLPATIFQLIQSTLDGTNNHVRDDSRGSDSGTEDGVATANSL